MIRAISFLIANILLILGISLLVNNFTVADFMSAFIFLVVLTFLNWTIVPIFKLFTFPITLLTLGLFGLVINLFAVWLATVITEGVRISGGVATQIVTVIFVSILLSIGHMIIEKVLGNKNKPSHNNNDPHQNYYN